MQSICILRLRVAHEDTSDQDMDGVDAGGEPDVNDWTDYHGVCGLD